MLSHLGIVDELESSLTSEAPTSITEAIKASSAVAILSSNGP